MTKVVALSLVVVLALTTWLVADRKQHPTTNLRIVTSFDFTVYPACRFGQGSNCMQAIRFYDADSGRRLADAPVSPNMTGRRQIVANARLATIPRGIYAVTVYLDAAGQTKEGLPGEVSRFRNAAQ